MKKVVILGATGFIGRNLLDAFSKDKQFQVTAVYNKKNPPSELLADKTIDWLQADLTKAEDVVRAINGQEIVIQAAATTSGAKDIVNQPHHHVTDNAVMNALIFRAAHEQEIQHVIFFSCTVMYPSSVKAVKEDDFNGKITERYFGAGWTKVYAEKMCEFYAGLGPTRYTAIRHSNIYGPHDKFDLERSHVFGATIAKVMQAQNGNLEIWGDGSDERDFLYIDDLVEFVRLVIQKQNQPFELLNLGSGQSISVRDLALRIINLSGKNLKINFDKTKPSIGFKLKLNIDKARKNYDWKPHVTLDEGIRKTLAWCKLHAHSPL